MNPRDIRRSIAAAYSGVTWMEPGGGLGAWPPMAPPGGPSSRITF